MGAGCSARALTEVLTRRAPLALVPGGGFGPLAGAAVNVTVFSYDGTMHVGINADPAAVSDPALLFECSQKSFDELLTVVG